MWYICNHYKYETTRAMIKELNISEHLMKHGIKPSYQRMKIMEYLATHKTHPTADMIYVELVNEIPTLSKTTVYNTLKLFADKGVALSINIENNEVRYDGDTSVHGHFKCTTCGEVYDFPVELNDVSLPISKDFSITEHHIYLKGYCNKCKN